MGGKSKKKNAVISANLLKPFPPKIKHFLTRFAKSLSLYSTVTQNYWRWGQSEFSRWAAHQTRKFALAIPTCWYLKTLKFALPPTRNIKFALPPTQNPNASQWNIGCVGSPMQNFCVGHVHFMFLCQFHLCWVANANAVFSGIWA